MSAIEGAGGEAGRGIGKGCETTAGLGGIAPGLNAGGGSIDAVEVGTMGIGPGLGPEELAWLTMDAEGATDAGVGIGGR